MTATLWTHSLESQRRLLLSSVAELLKLETALRQQRLPVSLDELNARLLLISRLVPGAQRAPWTVGLLDEAKALSLRISDLELQLLQSRHAPPVVQRSEPDATGTSGV